MQYFQYLNLITSAFHLYDKKSALNFGALGGVKLISLLFEFFSYSYSSFPCHFPSTEGEDVMTKSSLARVRWQVTLVQHEPAQTPGWKLVQDTRKLSDEVHEVELLLESPELQKADFEDFSKQEDKLKVSR